LYIGYLYFMRKRSNFQVRQDRVKIAELYLRGCSQAEIAGRFGFTQQQISYDLKAIQAEWQRNTTLALDAHKARELAKIDHAERCYWQAWERSIEEFRSRTIKAKGTKDDQKVQTKPQQAEQTIYTENRSGDPRFLDGVLKCIERRCKLLGLDAPARNEHSGKDGGPIVVEDRRMAVRQQLKSNPQLLERIKNALRN
jgi:transcriptional regulator with XRE-family HTH domain